MRERIAAAAGALVLGAMSVAMMLTPASASTSEELRFRAVTTEQTFLDLGDEGPSLGDEYIFHDVLKQNGERVGHDGGVCTFTSVTSTEAEAQCVATLFLEGGQIAVQGLIPFPEGGPSRFTVAVTGGTGQYEGATGELHVREISETVARLTLRLDS
jgi:hypothetical protein